MPELVGALLPAADQASELIAAKGSGVAAGAGTAVVGLVAGAEYTGGGCTGLYGAGPP